MTSLAMSDNLPVLLPVELSEKLAFKPKSAVCVEIKYGSLVLTSAAQRLQKNNQRL